MFHLHHHHQQVVSYGVGGHYEPHVDYFGEISQNVVNTTTGLARHDDRVATLIYYLNDVTAGQLASLVLVGGM